jgi:hypothetical protein
MNGQNSRKPTRRNSAGCRRNRREWRRRYRRARRTDDSFGNVGEKQRSFAHMAPPVPDESDVAGGLDRPREFSKDQALRVGGAARAFW